MREYIKYLARETSRILRRRAHLAGGLCGCLLLCMLAGCISLDPAFVRASKRFDETNATPALDSAIHSGKLPVYDENGEITGWRPFADGEAERMKRQHGAWQKATQ